MAVPVALVLVVAAAVGLLFCVADAWARPVSWSAPVLIDRHQPFSHRPAINSLACPSARFCIGVEEHGVVSSTNPTAGAEAWTATSFAGVPRYSGFYLGSVSCRSIRSCVVADRAGEMFTSTHPSAGASAWRLTRTPDMITRLSCPSRRLCVGVAGGKILTSTKPASGPHGWRSLTIDRSSEGGFEDLACPGPHLCVAIGEKVGDLDYGAYIATSTNPSGGRRAWTVVRPDYFSYAAGVSCPSVRFCVVSGLSGASRRNRGEMILISSRPMDGARSWRARRVPALAAPVACASSRRCVSASFSDGPVPHYRIERSVDPGGGPRSWKATPPLQPLLGDLALACGAPSTCVAADSNDNIAGSTDPARGGAWTLFDLGQGSNALTGVSCGSSGPCVAVDDAGNALVSTDPSAGRWRVESLLAPRGGYPTAALDSVSCTTVGFCAATSGTDILTSANAAAGAWTDTRLPSLNDRLAHMSCVPSGLCVSAGSQGEVVVYPNGVGHEIASQLGSAPVCDKYGCSDDPIIGVSCVTETFCAATDGANLWVSRNPAGGSRTWRKSPLPISASSLTCQSPALCVVSAYDASAIATTVDPTAAKPSWTRTPLPAVTIRIASDTGTPSIDAISCPSSHLCVAVDGVGGYAFAGDPAGGTWSAEKIDASKLDNDAGTPSALTAVSCEPAGVCVAVDGTGHALIGRVTP